MKTLIATLILATSFSTFAASRKNTTPIEALNLVCYTKDMDIIYNIIIEADLLIDTSGNATQTGESMATIFNSMHPTSRATTLFSKNGDYRLTQSQSDKSQYTFIAPKLKLSLACENDGRVYAN